MKLTHLSIDNVLGINHIDLALETPVTIIAGSNGSGKSSIQNAIRLAMTGEPSRIALKKDFKQLVHEGQKKGSISITSDIGSYNCVLPKGTREISGLTNSILPYLLDPGLFASLSDKDRRSFLFKLSGVKPSTEDTRKRLASRGCDVELAEEVLPLLKQGFPVAHKTAAENATLAKGSWQSATGERWGASKADGWEMPIPEAVENDLQAKVKQLETINTTIPERHQQLGRLRQQAIAHENESGIIERLKDTADFLDRRSTALTVARESVEGQESIVADLRQRAGAVTDEHDNFECPECHVSLVMENGNLAVDTFEKSEIDKEAITRLPEHENALEMVKRALNNCQRDYDESLKASEALNDRPAVEEVKEGDIFKCKSKIGALENSRDDLNIEIQELRGAVKKVEMAENANKRATEYQKEITAWLSIAQAFAPDGIPGEMLGEALEPLNKRLRESAQSTEWMQPRITIDMEIETSRPYALLCESEQWRVNAMVAEAISHVSEMYIIVLDRFDVLDIAGRTQLLQWMEHLADTGQIETALLFGTMKSASWNTAQARSHWLENGCIAEREEVAA